MKTNQFECTIWLGATVRFLCLFTSTLFAVMSGYANAASVQTNSSQSNPVDIRKLDRYFDVQTEPSEFFGDMSTRERSITLTLVTGKDKPEALAVFVGKGEEEKDPGNSPTEWIPFSDKLKVDLGEGDGKRQIFIAARWKATDKGYTGTGFGVTVFRSRTGPTIVITNPSSKVTSQPIIQLQGYSPSNLGRIEYEVFTQNEATPLDKGEGHVTDRHFDRATFEWTTNWFQCWDIELKPGTNRIVLRCADMAGNQTTTNLIIVFSTVGDHTPPVFAAVTWPSPKATLIGGSLTARGLVDDCTAQMTGQIVSKGQTNAINGYPERNGCFWFENIPLNIGENYLTLVATDAAGNSSMTNLLIYGADGPIITLDPVIPASKLWDFSLTMTGKVRPANYRVWINGVQATVKPDGTWTADKVPVQSPNGGGVASFEMTASPLEESPISVAASARLVEAYSSLGTNATVLNATSPACGIFKLYLDEIGGRSFVLQASTNLVDWTTLFTNSSQNASFNYVDSEAGKNQCRFFRVVPLQ